MRIPTYTSERNIGAPQIQTPRVSGGVDLSAAINGFEYAAGIADKERQEKYNIFVAAESQRTGFELDQKYAELKDRIANGGSYANAEKEFQKFYEKTTQKSIARFGDDKNTAAKIMLDYERTGMEYGLRIKSAVKSRMKSDAVNAVNSRLDNLQLRLSNATNDAEMQLILGEAAQVYSRATNGGIIKSVSAQNGLRKMLNDAVNYKIDRDPIGFLSDVEKNPKKYEGVVALPDKIIAAKNQAIKFSKIGEVNSAVNEIIANKDLAQRAMLGELTAKDYENVDNPIIKAVVSQKKSIPDSEKAQALIDINNKAMALDVYKIRKNTKGEYVLPDYLSTQEGMTKAVEDIRKFQSDLMEAQASGVFTGRQSSRAMTMYKNAEQLLGNLKMQLEQPDMGVKEWFPGIQNPQKHIASFADEMTKGLPITGIRDWEAKVEFQDRVTKALGNYQSSGSSNQDREKIYKAMNEALISMAEEQFPELRGSQLVQEADRIISPDGDMKLKPNGKINGAPTEEQINSMTEEELKAYLAK